MLKLLVVDDDKIIRRGIISILQNSDLDCEIIGEAQNGRKALELIKELKPDLVITDIKMPVMDGMELIKALREASIEVRVVVLSGFDDYKYVRETMKDGAVDYLLKPVENEDLICLIKKIDEDLQFLEVEKEKNHSYNVQVLDGIAALKEKFLKRLLKQDLRDSEYYNKKLSDLNIDKREKFLFGVINVDDYYLQQKKNNRISRLISLDKIKKLFEEFFKVKEKAELIITEENEEIIFIVASLKQYKEELNIQLQESFENFKKSLFEDYDSTASFGISNWYEDLLNTKKASVEANLGLNRRFYLGKNRIHYFGQDEITYKSLEGLDIKDKMNKLITNVELCNSNEIKINVEVLMSYVYSNKLSPENIRRLLSDLTLMIYSKVPEFKFVTENLIKEDFDLFFYYKNINTFEELKEYLVNAFIEIVQRINGLRSERSTKTIEIAKDYIKQNYNKDINLKMVADKVYLNPNYFSELFKNETNKNFIDYLIETRINMAKEKLKEPGVKVYEVSDSVGYKEVVSFNRAFKKVVGVSPKEYVKLIN